MFPKENDLSFQEDESIDTLLPIPPANTYN